MALHVARTVANLRTNSPPCTSTRRAQPSSASTSCTFVDLAPLHKRCQLRAGQKLRPSIVIRGVLADVPVRSIAPGPQDKEAALKVAQTTGGERRDPTGSPSTIEVKTSPSTLVLMRHGESMWNHLKLFTGDVDIPLTEKGVMEALAGGKAVSHINFDMIFTSRLVRSKQTALIAMTQSQFRAVPVIVRGGYYGTGKTGDANRLRLRAAAAQALEQAACRTVPVYADQALNERCYGDLQGLSKEAAVRQFGADTVQRWRRSQDTRPPHGESLEDTRDRSLAFFKRTIEPRLAEGHNVLLVAHGNVLRCFLSYLSGLTDQEMLRLQVITALPYTFVYDGTKFAECCVLPYRDPVTNEPLIVSHMGLSSVMKKGEVDSLI